MSHRAILVATLALVPGLARAGEPVPAQGPPLPRFEGRVLLHVSAPESIQATLGSCLAKELGRLDGVTVVDKLPDYEISVLGVPIGPQGGAASGCALSVTVLKTIDAGGMCEMMLASQPVSPERRAWVFPPEQPFYGSYDHFIRTGPASGLAQLCAQVVETFDGKHLKPARALRQRQIDARKPGQPPGG